jgi:phenylalanyl-tRNA synthetase beta chain
MKVPISWLKDYVNITLSVKDLAERLTLAGLEVGGIQFIGLPGAELEWPRDKLVLGQVLKIEQHPNADKLVLATVDIGNDEPEVVVTGAPNLYQFIGQGDLSSLNLKSPFVMEGATVYDGHAKEPGTMMKLKGRKIRGIMNRHMLCSEKELGLSDEHEGIIIDTNETADPGTPLVDLWGDAVLDIDITPNMIRDACILGVAREVAALTDQTLRAPELYEFTDGTGSADLPSLSTHLNLETTSPDLNPRFVAILIEGIEVGPSPYWLQRRLRLAGQRPINNIVDISNYVMLEVGQPNHAFDWDILRQRAGDYAPDEPVKIITRLAQPGEKVTTLDEKVHEVPDYTILVTDPAGNLSIGGIMGGLETEVDATSTNILLEAAAWNFINIRRSSQALGIHSEAGYRFSRGIHPELALVGAKRGAKLMTELAGGRINYNMLDYYPKPFAPVVVDLPQTEVSRSLGIDLSIEEITHILESLEFLVEETNPVTLRVTVPDHRLDISSEPVSARADLIEEIARIYGYDRIPVTEMADELPPQRNNLLLDREEKVRDLLTGVGLQEVITYRLTTVEAEARVLGAEYVAAAEYVTLANPTTPERSVMRHSLLNSLIEILAENSKHQQQVRLFEVGLVYLPSPGGEGEAAILPLEQSRLAIAMSGPREAEGWVPTDTTPVNFFDIKGVVEALLDGLHLVDVTYEPAKHLAFYPGRTAEVSVNGQPIGLIGQLHPRVVAAYEVNLITDDQPVLAADFDLNALLAQVPEGHVIQGVPRFPPVQQDIAVVVDENVPAVEVLSLIRQTGQPLLREVRLFDVYRGDQVGFGKKSLAYSLTFQAEDRTLTDKVVAKQQNKIVRRLEGELGARLRS